MSRVKERVLLLLLGGLAFGYSYTFRRQWIVLKTIAREWKRINREELRKEINSLYRLNYISKTKDEDGLVMINLTEKGRLKALNRKLDNIKGKKEKWDGKWRMVAFDIPERYKKGRDALRRRLKESGFTELQKSVFITRYDCLKEIQMLVEFFNMHQYVRFGTLDFIDNENYFKKVFKLS